VALRAAWPYVALGTLALVALALRAAAGVRVGWTGALLVILGLVVLCAATAIWVIAALYLPIFYTVNVIK